eukprot:CAMPEP_0198700066 /NCGR_PEP_ID=MMETSP1468-20131203/363844_1 /TAXON_ID=1461545 /ORGANISM="Mantoniella sp, Strain CCMP1436" /LENGTH=58 /DNA_ID=CAMNT_0044457841 /DNA_START=489 /DNA_END=665 /DNA_ORIENTATION=-
MPTHGAMVSICRPRARGRLRAHAGAQGGKHDERVHQRSDQCDTHEFSKGIEESDDTSE